MKVDENGIPNELNPTRIQSSSGVTLPPNSYSFFVSPPFQNIC